METRPEMVVNGLERRKAVTTGENLERNAGKKDARRGRAVHETARIGIASKSKRKERARAIERLAAREGEMEGRQTRRPQPGGSGNSRGRGGRRGAVSPSA